MLQCAKFVVKQLGITTEIKEVRRIGVGTVVVEFVDGTSQELTGTIGGLIVDNDLKKIKTMF